MGDDADGLAWPLVEPGTLEHRAYQVQLAEAALADHTLVCLPTGLGKTSVSLLVTASRLAAAANRSDGQQGAGGSGASRTDVADAVGVDADAAKSLLLAPTKPLVEQHADFYRDALAVPDDEIVVFTGEVRPDDRAALWEDATVVIATPQVVENDLVGNRIDLGPVVHCTFDECHRATGDYPYTYVAERYHADADDPLATGMSASPGDDREAIRTVCANLGLAAVEVMTEDDADVAAYTHNTDLSWEHVELPEEVTAIRDRLADVIEERMTDLKELGVTDTVDADVSEREIQRIQAELRKLMDNDQSEGYQGMSRLAEVRKLRTALNYAETQSVESLDRYFERLNEAARSSGASKADQRLVSDADVRRAMAEAREFDDLHPKFRRVRMLVAETLGIEDGERVIVFTESRDTAETLTDFLGDHFDVERFVGQSDTETSPGMTQSEQQETLERFRAGEFEVLVSTSVAEEGLDVPEVDLVLFYEPVPTAIRAIQRKGRTGRQTTGRVVVLVAKDTRDEAYFWKARQDQERMESELRELKSFAGELADDLGTEQTALDGDPIDVDDDPADSSGHDADESQTDGSGGHESAQQTAENPGDGTGSPVETEGVPDGEAGGGDEGGDGKEAAGEGKDGEADTAARPATADGGATNEADAPDQDQAGLDAFSPASGTDSDEAPSSESDGTADTGAADGTGGVDEGDDGTDAVDQDGASGGTSDDAAQAESADPVTPAPASDEDGVARIVADQRELDSAIARDLSTRDGIETGLETLAVGDYVLSDRVVVERKTVADFLDTLTGGDRSMFEQVGDAARNYSRPVVVIEGGDLYGARNVHHRSIQGALASLTVDFGASVLQTADEAETADLLATIARREQVDRNREVSVHGEKQDRTLPEQQEYVLSSVAEVGPVTARSLLEAFGTVEAAISADEDDLQSVEGVGPVTAERFREVVASEYDPDAVGGSDYPETDDE